MLAVGILAHQFHESSLGGVIAAVQAYPDDPQPLVRLDHLLLRLSTCLSAGEKDIKGGDIGNMASGISLHYVPTTL